MKGERPEISVVVPVYNAAPYLAECVESVLGQTVRDFELLLVDDGSTDGSGGLCDALAAKDGRIHVLHQANKGVSAARNAGLDRAQGEYLLFLDADDLLMPDALQQCRSRMDGCDMVVGGIRKFDEKGDTGCITVDKEMICGRDENLSLFLPPESGVGDWNRYIFNRLFRKDVVRLHGLHFRDDIFYKEDGLFLVQFICRSSRPAVFIPGIVYQYRQTPGSAMNRLNSSYNDRLLTNVDAHGAILGEMRRSHVSNVLIDREIRHLIRNYTWISGIMSRSGAFNIRNRMKLHQRMLKNAGVVNYLTHLLLPAVKRSFFQWS